MRETATVYLNQDVELPDNILPGAIFSVVYHPLPIRVSATSNEDSLTVTLEATDRNERSILLTFPNSELTTIANHLLGLVRKPAKASGLKVKATGSAQHFAAFWALYPAGPTERPRKIAKGQILAKWVAQNLDKEWPVIQSDLNACIPGWAKENYKYLPLVTTYVNQRRWEARKENEQPEMPLV